MPYFLSIQICPCGLRSLPSKYIYYQSLYHYIHLQSIPQVESHFFHSPIPSESPIMLSERENIAIAEVAVYAVFIFPAIYVCIRHGCIKQLGWFYLVIFCGLRIGSGIMGIEFAKHPTSRDDATWSAILGSIGLSPLLLAEIGLLERL